MKVLVGKTTAKITSQHGLFYKYLIDSQGKAKAKQYLDGNEQAIRNIEEIITQEKIECEFERQNSYVFTEKQEEIEKIKEEVEALKQLEFDAEFVTKTELPFDILGGICFKDQADFNPIKYAQGLLDIIKDNKNFEIYENSKVMDLEKNGENYNVICENDKIVNSKFVVLASHYPIINFPGFYFLKMYQNTSYLVAMETKKKLFSGMYINSEKPTISLRTADNGRILLVGGLDHKTGEEVDLSDKYEKLENFTRKYYPDAKIINRWCTQDCISLDKIPYIGEFSNVMPNVYVATGFKKWGMTTSNLGAKIIVDKILQRENSYEDVFKATRVEPIKNHKEIENIMKQVAESAIIEKFKIPQKELDNIKRDEGSIIDYNGKKIGIYKDINGKIYSVKPICSHLGCELTWNNLEKTWDCPCHGSRFDFEGKSIYAPSIKDLEKIKIELYCHPED